MILSHYARHDHVLVSAWKNNYPRMPKASWLEAVRVPRSAWGLLLIFIVLGGIYTGAFTPTEAAAMSAVYAFVVAVFVHEMRPTDAEGVARLGQYERDDPLHHHQRGAVLVPMTSEQILQAMTAWIKDKGIGWVEFCWSSMCCCCLRAMSWSRLRSC